MRTNTTNPFAEYVGPGLYRVGQYGINIFNVPPTKLDELMIEHCEELDEEFAESSYDAGEGSLIYVEKMPDEKNDLDYIYLVVVINSTGKGVPFDVYKAGNYEDDENIFSGTDYSIFGSGNVCIEVKGKCKYKEWDEMVELIPDSLLSVNK